MSTKLSIIGSVGVPAKYGGFETLAEFLSLYLGKEFKTTVYCSGKAYKNEKLKSYNQCRLVYIPLDANGIQSIPYDILSILHAFFTSNVLLVLGVAGSFMFPFVRLFSRKRIVINIDGLEHRREKWNKVARWYLRFAERIAVKYAHVVVADNVGIQEYVKETYNKNAVVIPYGGDHFSAQKLSDSVKEKYNLPKEYAFKVCRIEPENNIGLILEAFKNSAKNLVIVGNWNYSDYGQQLYEQYHKQPNYFLLDPIYEQNVLNEIRSNCSFYVHGHSAGGTNPSLVEAMFLGKPIVAFDVNYNRYTTNQEASFFRNAEELKVILNKSLSENGLMEQATKAKQYAIDHYQWKTIADDYKNIIVRK